MTEEEGVVLRGINNIYTVEIDGEEREARIKGKVLDQDSPSYNPLAPGDRVVVEDTQILRRLPRENQLVRWNRKGELPQTLAANVDHVYCVTCADSPPFRPRFIDRLLIAAEYGGCEASILVNKIDQQRDEEMSLRLADYHRMGYRIVQVSAQTGEGMDAWKKELTGKTVVLTGQSGVGKSSLLNFLDPGLGQRVRTVSAKYNRGRHTTCFSLMHTWESSQKSRLIDTPGIREIELFGIEKEELSHWFRDLEPLVGSCRFSGCLHRDEPGCGLVEALEEGDVHPDRYHSYLSLLDSLERREPRYGRGDK